MDGSELYRGDEYIRRNPTYHTEDSVWKAGHILKLLSRNNLSPRLVREVGCGAGGVLEALYERLPEAVCFEGYEISPAGYELCRQRVRERLEFFLEDFASVEHPPSDVLLCIDVVEHVEDVRAFLNALRPQARHTVFHIPVELSAYKVLLPGRLLKSTREFGHIHFYTRETALDMLESAGYAIKDWFYTRAGVDCRRTLEARLGRLPVKLLSMLSDGLAARLFGAHSIMVLTE